MTKKELIIESLYIYQRLNDDRRDEIVKSVSGKEYMETGLSLNKFNELYKKLSDEMRTNGLNKVVDNKIFFYGSNLEFYINKL